MSPAPRVRFQPQLSAALLCLFACFFLFALALALPALLRSVSSLPPEGQQDLELAREVARDALRGRLPLAFAAALLVTSLAAALGKLPGRRSD